MDQEKHHHWKMRAGALSKHLMGTQGDPGGTVLVAARLTRKICSYIGAVDLARFVPCILRLFVSTRWMLTCPVALM